MKTITSGFYALRIREARSLVPYERRRRLALDLAGTGHHYIRVST
jgi:hypothetical protein